MTPLSASPAFHRLQTALRFDSRGLWIIVAVLIAGLFYLSTYQTHINSSGHPFATDVGEIQNALPRWGIIHHSSYPQYSAIGSLFISLLRLVGVAPAAGASLYSLVWGLASVGLLVVLAMDLGVAGPFAALGGLAAAVSTSVWMDASLAEVHTMTMALTVATLIFALRFGHSGSRSDLLWLTFVFSQGVFHQRSIVLLAPVVVLLVWPNILTPFRLGWRTLLLVVGVALLAPLTYLYLPLRVWMGADWVFGSPGTWDGFWTLFFDNRAGRVFDLAADWAAHLRITLSVLNVDLWLPLLAVGLAGLWLPRRRLPSGHDRSSLRISLGLTLVWVLNFLLTILIWEGQVSDALLAAKLPVLLMAGVGLAMVVDWLWRWSVPAGAAAAVCLAAALLVWTWQTRPFILEITRDQSTQPLVDRVGRVGPAADNRPVTVLVPWGADYWTLTYAQAFEGKLQGISLVDHNARAQTIIDRGDRLMTPERTFYVFLPSYYEERLGPLFLSSAVPGMIEISPTPILDEAELALDSGIYPASLDLENGARVWGVKSAWAGPDEILLTVYWQADRPIEADYSTAVHLVAQDPPASEADILHQADRAHPVDGWYPTTKWREGEIVRDMYLLTVPEGSDPAAIRIAMYRNDPEAGFVNTPWLSLPLPSK